MKLGLQTWGSDGDIRPFVALAGGLSAAGHDVTLVVTSVDNKDYTPLSEALNFTIKHSGHFDYSSGEIDRFVNTMRITRNPLQQVKLIASYFFDPAIERIYQESIWLCNENDMVIGHFFVYPLSIAAEKAGRPYISVSLSSATIPSKHLPPPGLPNLGKFMNSVCWKLGELFMGRTLLPAINQKRRQEKLTPVKKIFKEVMASNTLNLIAASSFLCPPQPDWGNHHQVCGFFNVPEQGEQWRTPDRLKRFLHKGPSPVYMTFGSILSFNTLVQETTRLMVDAARIAGCRAIIQSGWEMITDIPEDPDVYRISPAPHRYLFPHCAAVVHHGGAGTTQSAMLYGCPSVVVEHFGDQIFWGRELRRLGIAPRLLHRRSVTPEKLARAIRTVLDSPDMKNKAEKIGKDMKNEDGVERAVELLEILGRSFNFGR